MQKTNDKNIQIQEFGINLGGIDYIDRPGVYAVIENSHKQVAVIETSNGYFLPGGGIETAETETEALEREVLEETGYQISILSKVGNTIEYIQAFSDGKHYRIISTFYEARIDYKVGDGSEKDHHFVWCSQEDALRLLTRKSQAWAIRYKKRTT